MGTNHPGTERRSPGCADTAARCILFGGLILLAGLVVLAVLKPPQRRDGDSRVGNATATIVGLGMALEMYHDEFGAYPPDSAVGLHADLNSPAECLVYYLSGKSIYYDPVNSPEAYPWRHDLYNTIGAGASRKDQAVYYEFGRRALADTDGDGLPEVVDGWGKPLLYNSGPAENGPFNQNGAPKHNRGTFDLSSAGPDGKHATADDVANWRGYPAAPPLPPP